MEKMIGIKIKGVKILLFLSKKLIPKNFDLDRFKKIVQEFEVFKKIICLPDLNFKSKNFIPSGVNIPIKNKICPLILSSNINDSIGAIHVKNEKKISNKEIKDIFHSLKKEIVIFRRNKNVISKKKTLENYLDFGVKKVYKLWGFSKTDITRIENFGYERLDFRSKDLLKIIDQSKIKFLPKYIPSDGIYNRGFKNIGILDGTSHFIELFKVKKIKKKKDCKYLNISSNDLFFLIHAGSGDIGRIFHHYVLEKNVNNVIPHSKLGKLIKNFYLAASNYGFVNRLYIYKKIKKAISSNIQSQKVNIFSDLPHDYLDIDKKNKIFYHKKGVVKILPKSKFSSKNRWSKTGTPYILPSHPGGDAYLMINKKGNNLSSFSLNHGMGRVLSKEEAGKKIKSFKIKPFKNKTFQMFRYYKDNINTQSPKSFKNEKIILKSIKDNKLAENIAVFESLATLKA